MGQTIAKCNVVIFVNGTKHTLDRVDVVQSLAQWLRACLALTGTKLGCESGVCGACTVMVSRFNSDDGTISHVAVNACLLPVIAVDHCHVTTIEASANTLQQLQERFAAGFATQCGFCSPGMIMSLYATLRSNPKATREELQMSIDGNLCRCTGEGHCLRGCNFCCLFCLSRIQTHH
jgi:xanthine dehydrogenase/oxidase